jgi:ribulose-5-phosphate 4-epimerase/fuculose-1-phosphate aldolase
MGVAVHAATDAETEIRVDLAALYRLVAAYGWDDLIFTHISARIPGPEPQFLINPYGLMFDEITASSLIKVDPDGTVVGSTVGYRVNPAGFVIHSAIHAVREDAMCVMHLHTLDGTAVATSALGLQPLNQTAQLVCDDLAYHDYEGVALDLDERARLQRDLASKNLMLLRNHGTLSVGRSCAEAFMRMYFLERACSIQVRGYALGRCVSVPSEVVAKNSELARSRGFLNLAHRLIWPAMLRKLDRIDASYRD